MIINRPNPDKPGNQFGLFSKFTEFDRKRESKNSPEEKSKIMVWNWVDDDDAAANPNPRNYKHNVNNDAAETRNSSTRRIVTSSCKTEEVEPGRFVKKCDKTEQILRNSIGRPAEVVESKTEHTEEDVTNEVKSGKYSFESSGLEPFSFSGLRSDIESIEQRIAGEFGTFMEMAEEMAKGFFGSFEFPTRSSNREPSSFDRYFPSERRQVEIDGAGKAKEEETASADSYDVLPGEVVDV